jgi:hypothetical protein
MEQMPLTFRQYFDPGGRPINAASILPGMLRDFGDVEQVLSAIAPRKMLSTAGLGDVSYELPAMQKSESLMAENPTVLIDWLK